MADSTRVDSLEWAFILALVGGILILVGGFSGLLFMGFGSMGGGWGMMPMMGGYNPGSGWFWGMGLWMGFWGIAAGVVTIVAAVRFRTTPSAAGTWGIVAIVAGAVSLLGMGGYFIGAAAAIAGGALAVTAQGPSAARRQRV